MLLAKRAVYPLEQHAAPPRGPHETRDQNKQILSLQPRESSGGGGRSNDDIVTELAEELEAQIPPLLEDEDAGPTTFILQASFLCTSREQTSLCPFVLQGYW